MKEYQFEEKILIRSCLVLSIILPIATIDNIIFNLGGIATLLTGFSSIFFMILYYIGSRYGKFNYIRLIISLYALVFLNIMFFNNYGSRGPILCNFIAVLCALIFIWDRKRIPILATIFLINLFILIFIELKIPSFVKSYPNEHSRIIDMYVGTIISFLFIVGYAFYSKEKYVSEYLRKSQSDQFKSAFLINLYGELKIPLKTIVGYTELLEITDNEEKIKQYVKTISKSSKQLLLFMNDIFDLSLIESNQLIVSKQTINIKDLISEVISNIENEKEKKSVEIKENFPTEDYFLNTDISRLKKVIQNLVLFAIKQTIKGEVKISVIARNNKCQILISGTGIEIAQKEIDYIFYQKNNESEIENFSETMLEFFIYKKLISLLEGEIIVESFPGKGTTFLIKMPMFK